MLRNVSLSAEDLKDRGFKNFIKLLVFYAFSWYGVGCSSLGQFVFNKWKLGLFSVPFLYPIPVVVVSPTGVKY